MVTNTDRLDKFWSGLRLIMPESTVMDKATALHILGMPHPAYNHVTDVDVQEKEVDVLMRNVIDHFASAHLPFACVRVSPLTRPSSLPSFLERHRFVKGFEQSIMVFDQEMPSAEASVPVEIKEMSAGELDIFDELVFPIFEVPVDWKDAWDQFTLEFLRKGATIYLAYVQGKLVGTATLYSQDRTGCIFSVGTNKDHRKHGIGTALVKRALADSIEKGNDLHTLQTNKGEAAERLYRRLGFEVDHTAAYYVMKLG